MVYAMVVEAKDFNTCKKCELACSFLFIGWSRIFIILLIHYDTPMRCDVGLALLRRQNAVRIQAGVVNVGARHSFLAFQPVW